MDKSPEAFRTISEVAEDLDLPQHVLRFWETRFAQIKPLKRGGGRRYYRPDDIDLLRGIRRLLYGEGYTIKGVQRILRDQGLRHVAGLGHATVIEAAASGQGGEPPMPAPPPAGGPELYAPPAERALAGAPFAQPELSARDFAPPSMRGAAAEPEDDTDETEAPDEADEQVAEDDAVEIPDVRPPTREDEIEFGHAPESPAVAPPVVAVPPVVTAPAPPPPPVIAAAPPAIAAPPGERPPERPAPSLLTSPPEPSLLPARPTPAVRPPLPRRDPEITAEGLRRLRATMFELTECKRLLEEARQA